MTRKKPIILAIDTSCDDTSVAITKGNKVLSNVIASQTEIHKFYGGVFPTMAKQAHLENIDPTTKIALKRARITLDEIDYIAVTQGPGLAPALEIGIKYALDLAKKNKKPIIAVNHIEGHVLSVLAESNKTSKPEFMPKFPCLSIVVSGGHSQFILVSDYGKYEIIGTTLDDAAGECLDKVGRMLDLGYPAGHLIEKLAKEGNSEKYQFPLPMTTSNDYNLSFSGIKTFARNLIEKLNSQNKMNKTQTLDFCASFQRSVFRHISYKLSKILNSYDIQEIWLGGGVAANTELRRQLRETILDHWKKNSQLSSNSHRSQIIFRTPYTKKLCADNGAMIGISAYYQTLSNRKVQSFSDADFDRMPNLKIGDMVEN